MVGIYLSVWVRRGMLPHVRGVQVMSLGTGLLGYLGNKGGATLRLAGLSPDEVTQPCAAWSQAGQKQQLGVSGLGSAFAEGCCF